MISSCNKISIRIENTGNHAAASHPDGLSTASRRLDRNSDQELTFAEFRRQQKISKAGKLRRKFGNLDTNGDGRLSMTEFSQRKSKDESH